MFRMIKTIKGAAAVVAVVASGCHGTSNEAAAAETTAGQTSRGAVAKTSVGTNPGQAGRGTPLVVENGHALAAFAEGCFWGSENTFRHVPGVVATAVGYTGGKTSSPTYEDVSSHTTGHAETVLVEFDPAKVTYAQLLGVFFRSHDPTTKNRQGPDIGDQYRSAIFTFSPEQDTAARAAVGEAQAKAKKPIVTQISPIGRFWIAEDYHQQYDEKTGRESCPLPSVLYGK
ncbi:peptide-methionine (S)-S-oxide reductase MsrA [Pendulispora brunnea]|uniref:Peptide methionine sulfoxide reductase MsrA n=1 Tax=Pendulispora brunnea TaxID=2905690 RepID=A0ABZ2JWB8_9BACT